MPFSGLSSFGQIPPAPFLTYPQQQRYLAGTLHDAEPFHCLRCLGRACLVAGDRLARLPFARLQALQDQSLDLLVQGAEGRCGGARIEGARLHGHGCVWVGWGSPFRAVSIVESYLI